MFFGYYPKKKKAGLVLESFAPKPVMYYNFVAPFVLSFVMYVCLCSLFLETGYEMLRIYM